MNKPDLEQAILKELSGINKSLNIIASEVKANHELKQSIDKKLDDLEQSLKTFRNDPFGIKEKE